MDRLNERHAVIIVPVQAATVWAEGRSRTESWAVNGPAPARERDEFALTEQHCPVRKGDHQ